MRFQEDTELPLIDMYSIYLVVLFMDKFMATAKKMTYES